jgi:hypothetical protein
MKRLKGAGMKRLAEALLWFCLPILGIFLVAHPWTEPGGPGPFWILILPLLMIGATFLNPFLVVPLVDARPAKPSKTTAVTGAD